MSAASDSPIRKRPARSILIALCLTIVAAAIACWLVDRGVPALTARASFRAHPRATLTWYTSGWYEKPGIVMGFSPDGRLLATGGEDGRVKLWDSASGQPVRSMVFKGKVEWVGFTSDGKYVVAEGHGSIPILWETRGPQATSVESRDASASTPPPVVARSQPVEASAMVWDTSGTPVAGLFSPPIRRLAREAGGIRLLPPPGPFDERVRLWDDAIRRDPGGLWGLLDEVPTFASPDGSRYATGGAGTVWLWGAGGVKEGSLSGKVYRSPTLAFSSDGRLFVAGSCNGSLTIHELATGRDRSVSTPGEGRPPLTISPDGRVLASVGRSLSTAPPGWLRRLPIGIQSGLYPYVMGGNGIDFEDSAALWDARTGNLRSILPGHKASLTSIVFSPDGRSLATSDWDGNVRIWAVKN